MQVEFETKVLGGLPVTIAASVYERGKVVDEWWISEVNGRAVKSAPAWIYNKLTSDDRSDIVDDILECCI